MLTVYIHILYAQHHQSLFNNSRIKENNDCIVRPMIENGKNPQKYIRFTPEDLERMLSEFFEGKTWNEQRR